MDDWTSTLLCLAPDLIAGIVVGILAGLFFARRYGLEGKQRRRLVAVLTAALTLGRYILIALLLLLYSAIVQLSGLAE